MGLAAPIVNAPMGGVAGGALAAAVSRAGGLGMVGIGSAGCASQLDEQLGHVRALGRPFGIGLVAWLVASEPQLLTAAIDAEPALLSVSFGEDFSWVRRAHDAGITAAAQVGSLRAAVCAVEAGCDVVIARGAEAGGHGEPSVGTLPLLATILDRLPVPVLAAGGVSCGRALAAVLAAGASGAWVGTSFSACTETLTSDNARRALLAAQGTDTVSTRVFDIAASYPWQGIPERVLRNGFTDRWHGHERELTTDSGAGQALATAIAADDPHVAPVNAGQGVAMLRSVRPAAEVINEMCADAARQLDRRYTPWPLHI
jgi:nitronate monooxygenase